MTTADVTHAADRDANCPACGYHVVAPFFDGGNQPLATLAWPVNASEAENLPRLPLDFVCCVDCGHVFNVSFDYARVPYSDKPNLMFNRARHWSRFLEDSCREIVEHIPETPSVVEIGHGDGSFLSALAAARPLGRFVGFDPHGSAQHDNGPAFRRELFDPKRHLSELRPDLVISRHVLEHLVNPLGFLQRLAFEATAIGLTPLAYFEVPCIDHAVATGRTVDFYYEHSSQFTTQSFTRMLSLTSREIIRIGHGYGREVVYGFARLGVSPEALQIARRAEHFRVSAEDSKHVIWDQLTALHKAGKVIAIWGGTGKSAAFMCRYGADRERFPIVVDSDREKVGTFVPGTGQEIRFRDYLIEHRVDAIIIPSQWRSADIAAEMASVGITADLILIEHGGRLIDFNLDKHPYQLT